MSDIDRIRAALQPLIAKEWLMPIITEDAEGWSIFQGYRATDGETLLTSAAQLLGHGYSVSIRPQIPYDLLICKDDTWTRFVRDVSEYADFPKGVTRDDISFVREILKLR